MRDAVHPKLPEIRIRRGGVVQCNEVRAACMAVFDSAQRGHKRTAGMGKHHPQIGAFVKHPCKNHRARGAACFRGHAHQPGKPVSLHVGLAHHVQGWMNNAMFNRSQAL